MTYDPTLAQLADTFRIARRREQRLARMVNQMPENHIPMPDQTREQRRIVTATVDSWLSAQRLLKRAERALVKYAKAYREPK